MLSKNLGQKELRFTKILSSEKNMGKKNFSKKNLGKKNVGSKNLDLKIFGLKKIVPKSL